MHGPKLSSDCSCCCLYLLPSPWRSTLQIFTTLHHGGEEKANQCHSDVSKPAPRGAAVLQTALRKVGIDAGGGSFPTFGEDGFLLYVGLRAKPKQPSQAKQNLSARRTIGVAQLFQFVFRQQNGISRCGAIHTHVRQFCHIVISGANRAFHL